MPAINYSQIMVSGTIGTQKYLIPTKTISVSVESSLESSRILASNQNNNYRIAGPAKTKVSMSFVASDATSGTYSLNFASGALTELTGTGYVDLSIAQNTFAKSYLESINLEVVPHAPVILNAEFICLDPPEGAKPAIYSSPLTNDIANSIAYGWNTTYVGDQAAVTEASKDKINYKVNCNRSYTASIGQIYANNVFLDSVEKEASISSTNISRYINYSGSGGIFAFSVKNSLTNVIPTIIFNAINSKVMTQNISVQEGGVLGGEVTIKQTVL